MSAPPMTSPTNPTELMDNRLCSHSGSCADNYKRNGGWFCANLKALRALRNQAGASHD